MQQTEISNIKRQLNNLTTSSILKTYLRFNPLTILVMEKSLEIWLSCMMFQNNLLLLIEAKRVTKQLFTSNLISRIMIKRIIRSFFPMISTKRISLILPHNIFWFNKQCLLPTTSSNSFKLIISKLLNSSFSSIKLRIM